MPLLTAKAPEQQPQSSLCQRRQRQWMGWCASSPSCSKLRCGLTSRPRAGVVLNSWPKSLVVLSCRPKPKRQNSSQCSYKNGPANCLHLLLTVPPIAAEPGECSTQLHARHGAPLQSWVSPLTAKRCARELQRWTSSCLGTRSTSGIALRNTCEPRRPSSRKRAACRALPRFACFFLLSPCTRVDSCRQTAAEMHA